MSAGILPAFMFAGFQPAAQAKARGIPMPAKAGAPLPDDKFFFKRAQNLL